MRTCVKWVCACECSAHRDQKKMLYPPKLGHSSWWLASIWTIWHAGSCMHGVGWISRPRRWAVSFHDFWRYPEIYAVFLYSTLPWENSFLDFAAVRGNWFHFPVWLGLNPESPLDSALLGPHAPVGCSPPAGPGQRRLSVLLALRVYGVSCSFSVYIKNPFHLFEI